MCVLVIGEWIDIIRLFYPAVMDETSMKVDKEKNKKGKEKKAYMEVIIDFVGSLLGLLFLGPSFLARNMFTGFLNKLLFLVISLLTRNIYNGYHSWGIERHGLYLGCMHILHLQIGVK